MKYNKGASLFHKQIWLPSCLKESVPRKKSSKTLNEPIGSQLITETFVVAKIKNWNMSEKIKSAIIKANQNTKSTVCLADVLKVSEGKKKSCLEVASRSQRARPINPRFIKFPATLMIKCTAERKYSLEKEFLNTVFF